MEQFKKQIDNSDLLLKRVRQEVSEYSDFSACRNIVEMARQNILNIVYNQGLSNLMHNKSNFVRQTLFLADLLSPDSSQISPLVSNLNFDFWDFLHNEFEPLTLSPKTQSKISDSIEVIIDNLLVYLDSSFSNVDSIINSSFSPAPNSNYKEVEEFLSTNQDLTNLEQITSVANKCINSQTLSHLFSQVYEINRVLYRQGFCRLELDEYVKQQDILYNAYSGFSIAPEFDLSPSPVSSITPIHYNSLSLAISNPVLASQIVDQMSQALAATWLKVQVDLISDQLSEKAVRAAIDVSRHYSESSLEDRHSFDVTFESTPLLSFYQNAYEIGANKSFTRAQQILEQTLDEKYLELLLEATHT